MLRWVLVGWESAHRTLHCNFLCGKIGPTLDHQFNGTENNFYVPVRYRKRILGTFYIAVDFQIVLYKGRGRVIGRGGPWKSRLFRAQMTLVSLVAMSGSKKVSIFRAHVFQLPSKRICSQQNQYVPPRHKTGTLIYIIKKILNPTVSYLEERDRLDFFFSRSLDDRDLKCITNISEK